MLNQLLSRQANAMSASTRWVVFVPAAQAVAVGLSAHNRPAKQRKIKRK